tara:strand:- start:695 stop:1390 length:696 start_codon:yes stop_codon:yes gene_type:complete
VLSRYQIYARGVPLEHSGVRVKQWYIENIGGKIMKHIVIAGDSIFDNGAYVPGEQDVHQQLKDIAGTTTEVTSMAVDGSVTDDTIMQLTKLPSTTTHLFISTGGNDALGQIGLLSESVQSVAEAMLLLSKSQNQFRIKYRNLISQIQRSPNTKTVVCTIYHPNAEAERQSVMDIGVSLFNDVIIEETNKAHIPVLDIRGIFLNPEDYANEIEPSAIGGWKLANTMYSISAK